MDLTENISKLRAGIERHPDYSAALLAANLIEAGLSADDIVITRRKAGAEGVLHEIENISLKYPYLNPGQSYVEIESGRDGIYDSVTEGLFFTGEHSENERDIREIIHRIRQDRESEHEIRRFMQLFEVESDYFLTHINRKELQYDNALSYDSLCGFYAQYWDIISIMHRDDAMRFIRVIPHLSALRGDLQGASRAMGYIMGVEVRIQRIVVQTAATTKNEPKTPPRLGHTFVLKSDTGMRLTEKMQVTVSGINAAKCSEFIKENRGDKIMRFLCDMLLDADMEIDIKTEPERKSRGFSFGKGKDKTYYLGKNTYL